MRKAFYYKNYEFNAKTGILLFQYESMGYKFDETITFPDAPFTLTQTQKKALDLIFFYAHIAFGISYYKAFLNPQIVIESGTLTKDEADFFNAFYINGLGEFSVKNNVDIHIAFPYQEMRREKFQFNLQDRALVPVGGGKDSCVTIELLKAAGKQIAAVSLGNPRPIHDCVQAAQIPHIVMTRKISPVLLELNKHYSKTVLGEQMKADEQRRGVSVHNEYMRNPSCETDVQLPHKTVFVLNGHVPITGLISFLLWAAAVLYDYKYVAMSCERSANSGNMVKNGRLINHQYSKSLDYERDFYALTSAVHPEFRYFSLLRPYSEAHIAKLFATLCKPYFDVFTSCNKAFKLDATKRLDRWCGMCDKCRFVFLILAPFMEKSKLVEIVGNNPLNDISQLDSYKELLGLSGHKPFECVGEIQECQWAMVQLGTDPAWRNDAVVSALSKKIESNESDIFTPSTTHLIPKEYKNALQ